MTDTPITGPTVRAAGDEPEEAPAPSVAAPEPGSVADAIAQAGRKARRKRFLNFPLDLEGPIDFGIRLGIPRDASITIYDDEEGTVDNYSQLEFLAHRILCVVQRVEGKWAPVEGYTLQDLATMHARAMEGDPDLEPFEHDTPALQQLFTLSDPPEVNVQAVASMARSYRVWAMSGAEEDGDPISGP
ncbi:hypothetical protein [Patulibacter minatonensis]|uniref:hypothetical protein n=1 Tax=Patulibacter minatonensis TaxID=298163 RepID=UPI00047B4997|nr:hypothetical protein [Patulibacter minatonensis]